MLRPWELLKRLRQLRKGARRFSPLQRVVGRVVGAAAQLCGLGRHEGGLEGTRRQKSAAKSLSRSPPPALRTVRSLDIKSLP